MNKKLTLATTLTILIASVSPSSAVVNGSEILDADVTKPWVAQIYYAESASEYYEPKFICSGSLISETKILTAAHCVLDKGFYFVSLGARTLNSDAPLLEVESVWRHPRYSSQRAVNDIGVLKLTNPVTNVQPVALPSRSMTSKINKSKSYTIYGWGMDQNGTGAVYLRTAKLTNQDATAKRVSSRFGYSSTTMLAAGNYLKSEKIYAGACMGDSGGPLVSIIDGIETVVGVTSWVVNNKNSYCDLGYPSVFARVSYYLNDINKGVATVEQSATDNNRAAPSYSVKPSISGSARVGSVITCDTGKWSSNTTSITYRWTSPWDIAGTTSQTIQINSDDAGQTFTCIVTGSSKTASLPVTSTVSIPAKPYSYTYMSISGVSSYSVPKPGTTATCTKLNWNTALESETTQWYSSSSSYSFNPSTSQLIGTGSSISLSSSTLSSLYGKYLICATTGINAGGSATYYASTSISSPSKPYISYVTVGLINSTLARCSITTYSDYDSVSYSWGAASSYSFTFTEVLGTSSDLIINSSNTGKIGGKYLICKATISNSAGSDEESSNRFVAASSIVSPITRISKGESQSTNWVCPPETVKHKKGKLGFGSSIR